MACFLSNSAPAARPVGLAWSSNPMAVPSFYCNPAWAMASAPAAGVVLVVCCSADRSAVTAAAIVLNMAVGHVDRTDTFRNHSMGPFATVAVLHPWASLEAFRPHAWLFEFYLSTMLS